MVNLQDIQKSNASLQSLPPPGRLIAVFAGATSGIGLHALKAFARYVPAPTAFVICRSRARSAHIIDELKTINPNGVWEFIEAEVSLIKEVDRVCEEIKTTPGVDHVDILFLSPGFLSFGEREETSEGIKLDMALKFYSRHRLMANLLPLLSGSHSPRVVTIQSAGREGPINLSDLENRNTTGPLAGTNQVCSMICLSMEELAAQYPMVSFIHYSPGAVKSNITGNLLKSVRGVLYYPAQVLRVVLLPVVEWLLFTQEGEAGDRVLFLGTSAKYPPAQPTGESRGGWAKVPKGMEVARATVMRDGKGNGVYRISRDGESIGENKALETCREEGLGKLVRENEEKVWERAIGRS